MTLESFGSDPVRKALKFGNQKFNLHEYGKEFEPKVFIYQCFSISYDLFYSFLFLIFTQAG